MISQETRTLVFYGLAIALVIAVIVGVTRNSKSSHRAQAPFHNMPNPSNMTTQEVNDFQQTMMNIQGCKQIGGIWRQRPGGTGVCENWDRPGPPLS